MRQEKNRWCENEIWTDGNVRIVFKQIIVAEIQILNGINLLSSDWYPDIGQTWLYNVFNKKPSVSGLLHSLLFQQI